MRDCITTYTKVRFDTLNPKQEDIRIEDIAHALSLMTRANGHIPEFFSVAQHCLQCAEEALERHYSAEVVMACLLHDASEAYLSDVTRPVKRNLTMYLQIEKQLQNMIYEKYLGFVPEGEDAELIRQIDDACLYYELRHFMDERIYPNEPVILSSLNYEFQPMREVEEAFLRLFHRAEEMMKKRW